MAETPELPRPAALARTASWNLAESPRFQLDAYALAGSLCGRDAGVPAMLRELGIGLCSEEK